MEDATDVVMQGLAGLYKSGDFADCSINCGPYQFKVHKAIVGMHSKYFKTAFKSKFKEGESGSIELKSADSEDADEACDEPDIVKLMVEYFYHLDYTPRAAKVKSGEGRSAAAKNAAASLDQVQTRNKKRKKTSQVGNEARAAASKTQLLEHVKIFAIAVKYEVNTLRALAAEKFREGIASHWSHAEFAQALHLAYATTPDDAKELRELCVQKLSEHTDSLVKKPEIETVICSINGLAYEVRKRSSAPKCDQPYCCKPGRKYRCTYTTYDGGVCHRRKTNCALHTRNTPCGHNSLSYVEET